VYEPVAGSNMHSQIKLDKVQTCCECRQAGQKTENVMTQTPNGMLTLTIDQARYEQSVTDRLNAYFQEEEMKGENIYCDACKRPIRVGEAVKVKSIDGSKEDSGHVFAVKGDNKYVVCNGQSTTEYTRDQIAPSTLHTRRDVWKSPPEILTIQMKLFDTPKTEAYERTQIVEYKMDAKGEHYVHDARGAKIVLSKSAAEVKEIWVEPEYFTEFVNGANDMTKASAKVTKGPVFLLSKPTPFRGQNQEMSTLEGGNYKIMQVGEAPVTTKQEALAAIASATPDQGAIKVSLEPVTPQYMGQSIKIHKTFINIDEKITQTIQGVEHTWTLAAVIYHKGQTMGSGHYTTNVRKSLLLGQDLHQEVKEKFRANPSEWVEVDDEGSCFRQRPQIIKKPEGGKKQAISSQPYLLFYTKDSD